MVYSTNSLLYVALAFKILFLLFVNASFSIFSFLFYFLCTYDIGVVDLMFPMPSYDKVLNVTEIQEQNGRKWLSKGLPSRSREAKVRIQKKESILLISNQ